MKKITAFLVGFACTTFGFSQSSTGELKKVPAIELNDLNGKSINTSKLYEEGPVVISFWATWCAPCKRELNTIHEVYEDWQEETGIRVVAVSIDDEKTKAQVPMYVNGKGWDYVVLLDPNWDFKREMGVGNVPHTFLVDAQGNIVYTHTGYSEGDEEKLYEQIKLLKRK
jgi:thiol-disulfide isomerase/thioredoxin